MSKVGQLLIYGTTYQSAESENLVRNIAEVGCYMNGMGVG